MTEMADAKSQSTSVITTSNSAVSDGQTIDTTSSTVYRPTPPPVMPKPDVGNDLERKKNEIVQDMLRRIRPFMGPQGQLRSDADFTSFAKLMAGETHYVQRTLLLTVLLSATMSSEAPAIFHSICSSANLVSVLTEWLGESIKQDSPLVGKLLELYQRLPLTVDQLVEYRLGKLVKRLLGTEGVKLDVRDRAATLCEDWTNLARQEDAKRKASASVVASSAKKVKSEANTVQSGPAVVNMKLFNDSISGAKGETLPPAPPPMKTRAEQILERVARGETSSGAPTARPISADDIHRAKKRQQYLQEATTPHAEVVPADTIDNNGMGASDDGLKAKRKRVSFASDENLVSIRYFDPPEEDYHQHDEGHHYSTAHEMERNEASFAFKQMALVMEAEAEWTTPKRLESSSTFATGESKSVERQAQETREQKALSAVYFNLDDIPPSPAEPLDEDNVIVRAPVNIPLQDAEGRVSAVMRFVDPARTASSKDHYAIQRTLSPPAASASSQSSTDLLCSLLKDPNALQNILRNVAAVPPPSLPVMPPKPRPSRSQHCQQQFPSHHVPTQMASTYRHPPPPAPMNQHRPPPSMHMPPLPPGLSTMLPPNMPFPFPPPPMAFPPNFAPHPVHAQMTSRPPPNKNLCKYYRKGRAGSCRNGANCQFYHADR